MGGSCSKEQGVKTSATATPIATTAAVSTVATVESIRAMAEEYKYVVLGGGNSAGYVAKEFVAQGVAPNELAIIGEEPVVAYERPALSKGYLTGVARLPGFHTSVGGGGERQDPDWYTSKGIVFKVSSKVTAVDTAAKTLTLASGSTVKYGDLIVATGARPTLLTDFKTPGADLENVLYLRNEADAAGVVTAVQAVKAAGGQVVCIGGGYIGMEVAAGVASNEVSTAVVYPEDRLLARLLTPKLAEFYESVYLSKGIKLVKKAKLTGLVGTDGKVSGVEINSEDGSTQVLPANLVIVGVGAKPNVELFNGKLDLAAPPVGGIKVDGFFRTSVPNVYAIGDVAAFPLLQAGGALARQEHVTHARSSAAHVVQTILGKTTSAYDYLPYFYSRVYNLSWQFWGSQGDADAQVVHFGDVAAGKPGAYWVSKGKVVGVFLESATPEEAAAAKKLALDQPESPPDLEALGLKFATSRI